MADGTGRRADQGRIRHANGMEVETVFIDEMTWSGDTPSALFAREFELARGDWQTRIAVTGEMTSDRDGFDVRVGLIASTRQCALRRSNVDVSFPATLGVALRRRAIRRATGPIGVRR